MDLLHLKWIFRALRYRYRLEPQEIRLVQRHLVAGAVAVDVGAHKGAYTWWMRRAVGETGLSPGWPKICGPWPRAADIATSLSRTSAFHRPPAG